MTVDGGLLFLHQLKWLCTLRYSTCNDSARYVWAVVFIVMRTRTDTTLAFFFDWQKRIKNLNLRHIYDYGTIRYD